MNDSPPRSPRSVRQGTRGALLAALLSLSVAIPLAWAWMWTPSIVDDGTYVRGQFCVMTVDAAGRHHAAYHRWDPFSVGVRNMLYATHPDPASGGPWSVTNVDTQALTGTEPAIAVDKDGYPHISYYESEFANLKHAWQDAGGWHNEFVDMPGTVGQFSAIAVDFAGTVYIAYYDASYPGLKFAEQDPGGPWTFSHIDTSGTVGLYTSMVLGAGPLHVAYYDLTKRNLRYAEKTGGGWVTTTVDSIGDVGRFTSITVNKDGHPLIAYYDVTNKDLKLAERGPGNVWTVSTVDSPGDVGSGASIGVRDGSRPHILYYNRDTDDLQIAARTLSGGWIMDQVATTDDVGQYSAIVMAGAFPHALYFNATRERLDFATGRGDVTGVGDDDLPVIRPNLSLIPRTNPMRPPGAFQLLLPEDAGAVQVHIYDVTGRKVRELHRGDGQAGERDIAWDGRDAFGRRVASGRYLVTAETKQNKATTGLVVIH